MFPNVVSSYCVHGEVYLIQHCVTKFVSDLLGLFSQGTPVFTIQQTDHHSITRILLKVALNTLSQTINLSFNYIVKYRLNWCRKLEYLEKTT